MNSLKEKYRGWAIVHGGAKSYLGVAARSIKIGEPVTLKPCFELRHQLHLHGQPGHPPSVGLIPAVMPPDLCLSGDVTVHTQVDSFMLVDSFDEDLIALYDDIIVSVVQQFEAKRQAIRSARSGIVPAATMPANVDPNKFRSS